MTGGRASALSEPPPDGAWEDGGSTRTLVTGMLRNLDSAMSVAMKHCELGLVEQVDTPEPATARGPGQRVYRLITMRDRSIWVRVTWEGLPEQTGELIAKRTDQPFEVRVRAGHARDEVFERRLAESLTESVRELSRRERARARGENP